MGTYAVGDLMTTKPYISGAAYIQRMSDYCRGCSFDPKRNCPITSLYWAFLARHEQRLASNQRLMVPLAAPRRRPDAVRARDARVFQVVSDRPSQRPGAHTSRAAGALTMPEGHTLHRLARDPGVDLEGKKLRISSPQGRFTEATALDGATLRRTFAIGKHLFLDLDRALVHIHLGLFGKLKRQKPELPPRPSARLRLVSDQRVWELTVPTRCECQTPEQFATLKAGRPARRGQAPPRRRRAHSPRRRRAPARPEPLLRHRQRVPRRDLFLAAASRLRRRPEGRGCAENRKPKGEAREW